MWKGLTYLMLVNFINLSANFYHASEMDSLMLQHQDPIDSLAELVLEYVFEMDDETIPDTEIPHEKRKMADVKQLYFAENLSYTLFGNRPFVVYHSHYENFYQNWSFGINSPPPKSI
jgi:hypothetical protein